MLLRPKDILKKVNYTISYEYNKSLNTGIISVNLASKIRHEITYYPDSKKIVSDFGNINSSCDEYAAQAYAECILKNVCKHYGYPYHYVFFDNSSNIFMFYVKDIAKSVKFCSFANEIYLTGLNRDHIDECKKLDMLNGLQQITEYILNVKLK